MDITLLPLLVLILSLRLTSSVVARSHNNNVHSVFVFGDSIFDAGNNHYNPNCIVQADFPPYGSRFFHHPTGRFTNGRTVADFISEFLHLPLQKPYLEIVSEIVNGSRKNYPTNGINFASAGSGVLASTNNESVTKGVTPIQVQLQQFQTLVEQHHIDEKLVRSESLFFLESGSNDVYNYFSPFYTPTLTPEAYVQSMLTEAGNFIDAIYKLGGRRIALFELGPVGCIPARLVLPGATVTNCYDKISKMVEDYNMGLENIVSGFGVRYPGAVGVYGAVYTAVQAFRADPKRYGFVDVDNACCGYGQLGGELQCGKEGYTLCKNPDDHLFWDFFHPSERAYKLISKAVWAGPHDRIRPFNLKRLSNISIPHHM